MNLPRYRTADRLLVGGGIALLAMSALTACSAGGPETETESSESAEAPAAPLDLTGEWEQSNKNSEESFQEAVITADTITVNWVTDGGDTTSLYWAGTYEAPTEPLQSYAWDSINDTSQTDSAMLASGDDTKTFTFEGGVLSYEVSALGTTTKVELERR